MIKPKKKVVNYVDNERLFADIVKYRAECAEAEKAGKPKPGLTKYSYIGYCIREIAVRRARHRRFRNYSFVDEMIDDAIENILIYFDSFDPDVGKNPFAYFSQVAYFAFHRRIAEEEKLRYINAKLYVESSEELSAAGTHHMATAGANPMPLYDNLYDFIRDYEERLEEKKKKRAKRKQDVVSFFEEEEKKGNDKGTI